MIDKVLLVCYQKFSSSAWTRGDKREALMAAEKVLELNPLDLLALFNAGVADWHLKQSMNQDSMTSVSGSISVGRWRQRLQTFNVLAQQSATIPKAAKQIARDILSGTYSELPPFLVPPTQPSP